MLPKVVLYGAGERGRRLCKLLQQLNCEMAVTIVDSNFEKWGTRIGKWTVKSPDILRDLENVKLHITIADDDIIKEIRIEIQQKYQFLLENEINYYQLVIQAYKTSRLVKQGILEYRPVQNKERSIIFESSDGLGLGGVEAWTKDICTALTESCEDNLWIITDEGNYEIPKILENRIIHVNVNHKKRYTPECVLNLIELILKKLPCKIVASFTNDVMLAAYLIKHFYPDMIDLISVIHVGRKKHYDEFLAYKEGVDYYIAVSHDICTALIGKGAEPQRVFTMTCPFQCNQSLSRTYTENEAKPVRIGYAGRMDGMEGSQKRMDLVLKLIETLEEKEVDYQLELAGNGVARKAMEEFVRSRHLETKVQFLGTLERTELDRFWQRQDICINLADFEGRSISIIEAMGNGAIPVVTATSGVRDDITDDMNGYIVDLEDYLSMADRIEYLAKHRERLHIMGRKAHDVVYPKSLMEPHLRFWKKVLGITEKGEKDGCNR